jgi:hypothetical protein
MIFKEVKTSPELPKFKNSSDPRQRLKTMVHVRKIFPMGQKKGTAKSDPEKDRLARRIVAIFARSEKKAFAAFGLNPANEIDKEILLACLSWILFGKIARRGRPRSLDQSLEEVRQKIAPELEKNPKISDAALGKILRKAPAEKRKSDTLRKLVSKIRR